MKTLHLLISAILLLAVPAQSAVTVTHPSGQTDAFITGSTLTLNGVVSGHPTGGALDLSGLSLTLPSSYTPLSTANVSPRIYTIVIAASDSVNKAGADVVCTGTADQIVINAAIDTLTNGGTVFFRQGTYELTSEIVVDRDWVTLQGEAFSPHWSKYVGPYPAHEPVGAPGGSLFVQNTSGKGGILVGQTNFHAGDGRHKGLAFLSLYLYGSTYNGTGIYDTGGSDVSVIQNCALQGWLTAIDLSWDGGHIINNNIQDNAGYGIHSRRSYCLIQGNLLFDLGGTGIFDSATGDRIIGNMIGDVLDDAVILSGPNTMFANNYIEAVPGISNGITSGTFTGEYGGARNQTIVGNYVVLTADTAPNTTPNTGGYGIVIGRSGTTVNGCTVVANTVVNSHATAQYAIAILNGSANGLVGMNSVGLWNGANKVSAGAYATN